MYLMYICVYNLFNTYYSLLCARHCGGGCAKYNSPIYKFLSILVSVNRQEQLHIIYKV